MLWEIIKKEVREIVTSSKFIFTFILCTILILLSVLIGISNYLADRREYDSATSLNKQELASRTSYIDIAAFGVKINRQPQVLQTLVGGIESDTGRGLKVAAGADPQSVDSKYQSNPVLGVFGNLDLAYIVRIVLSLLAIVFTYESITGEKERGTLRLILSNRVPREKLILGKILGGFVCLLAALVVPFVLALIILMAYPEIMISGDDWLRIFLIFVLFLLYVSLFFMLGLFVSTRTHRSATSFLILIFIWVSFVATIPKISVMTAAQLRPIPSATEMTVQKDRFLQDLYGETQGKMTAFIRDNPPPKDVEGRKAWRDKATKMSIDLAEDRQKKYEAFTALLDRDYQMKKRSQDLLALNLSRLSPAGSLMFASMSVAKTGLDENQRFVDSVRAYWPIWYKWSDSKIRAQPDVDQKGGKANISDMPGYRYQAEPLSESVRRMLPDIALMIFLMIVFFSGAYWSFSKYDAR